MANKSYKFEMELKVGRGDIDKTMTVVSIQYPNCTYLDMVVLQDCCSQLLQQLVDLGYAQAIQRDATQADLVAGMKALVRSCP
jgi:hypothetical protein